MHFAISSLPLKWPSEPATILNLTSKTDWEICHFTRLPIVIFWIKTLFVPMFRNTVLPLFSECPFKPTRPQLKPVSPWKAICIYEVHNYKQLWLKKIVVYISYFFLLGCDSCLTIVVYNRLRRKWCFYRQVQPWEWNHCVLSKRWCPPTVPHGIPIQNNINCHQCNMKFWLLQQRIKRRPGDLAVSVVS